MLSKISQKKKQANKNRLIFFKSARRKSTKRGTHGRKLHCTRTKLVAGN